jgi:hypothetical protein
MKRSRNTLFRKAYWREREKQATLEQNWAKHTTAQALGLAGKRPSEDEAEGCWHWRARANGVVTPSPAPLRPNCLPPTAFNALRSVRGWVH